MIDAETPHQQSVMLDRIASQMKTWHSNKEFYYHKMFRACLTDSLKCPFSLEPLTNEFWCEDCGFGDHSTDDDWDVPQNAILPFYDQTIGTETNWSPKMTLNEVFMDPSSVRNLSCKA